MKQKREEKDDVSLRHAGSRRTLCLRLHCEGGSRMGKLEEELVRPPLLTSCKKRFIETRRPFPPSSSGLTVTS